MFRPMRRIKQQLSRERCEEILNTAKRGVLAVIGDDGYPFAFPVNFYYDREDSSIYIHSAKAGQKIDSIRRCDKFSFTALSDSYKEEGDWAWHVDSVVIMGRAELPTDPKLTEDKVRSFASRYYPCAEDVEREMRASISGVQLIALRIEHMTGKSVYEK